jgi:chitinase
MQSSIDFIFIQFYNNPSCNLDSAATFLSSLQAWSDDLSSSSSSSSAFVHAGNGVSGPRLFVGAPSFPAAGSGWVGGEEFARVLGGVVGLGLGNLGGVMLWDAAYGALSGGGDGNGSYGRTYMGLAKDVLGLRI